VVRLATAVELKAHVEELLQHTLRPIVRGEREGMGLVMGMGMGMGMGMDMGNGVDICI
jgi:hypothetical protein